jgi:hypothetical protein
MSDKLTLVEIEAQVISEHEFGAFAKLHMDKLMPFVGDVIKTAMILESASRALKISKDTIDTQLQTHLAINGIEGQFNDQMKNSVPINADLTGKEHLFNKMYKPNEAIIKLMMPDASPEEQKKALDKLNNLDKQDAEQFKRDFMQKFKEHLEGK